MRNRWVWANDDFDVRYLARRIGARVSANGALGAVKPSDYESPTRNDPKTTPRRARTPTSPPGCHCPTCSRGYPHLLEWRR
jgi:hypothetical protein